MARRTSLLYYTFFLDQFRQRADIREDLYADLGDAIYVLSMDNALKPFLQVVERVLARLSGRDVQRFDESHLHIIFAALLNSAQAWLVQSQPEEQAKDKFRILTEGILAQGEAENVGDVAHQRGFPTKHWGKSARHKSRSYPSLAPQLERRFVDILCTRLPSIPVNWNFAFEIKYLKQKDAAQLQAKAEEAKTQLEDYLQTEDLQRVEHLAAYAVVFVGAEAKSVVRVQ